MRYAHNLANGYGPVWNPGEKPIEGYSNPLWMSIMAIVHLLPIEKAKISLIIQMVSVITLLVNLVFVKKIAQKLSNNNPKVVLASLFFSAFYLPINTWAMIGMETGILMMLFSATTWLIVKNDERNNFNNLILIFPALGILFRMDIIILYFALFAFFVFYNNENRKKIFFSGTIILIIVLLIQFGFRFYFYDQWLPNTYYLKMTGYPILLRLTRGIYSTIKFIYFYNPLLFVLPILLVVVNRHRAYILIALLMIIQLAYSSYVGGDTWEWHGGSNRFISIIIPGYFILLSIALSKLIPIIYGWLSDYYPKAKKYYDYCYLILILICFLNINSLKGPISLSELFLVETPIGVIDNYHNVKFSLELKRILKNDAKATVTTAGVLPYFLECNFIDILGKNDKYISHKEAFVSRGFKRFIDFKPGHLKWDYSYSIKTMKPDAILQQWENFDEISDYLKLNYVKTRLKNLDFDIFLLKASDKINWNNIR
jgi:hypothetical protein